MIPKIIIYEEGRLVITPEAYTIKEIKDIIDKYDMDAEPYLMFVDKMTNPESSYINYEEEEKEETIIYDIINTISDFNHEEPLLKPAIERLQKAFTSTTKRYYDSLKISIDRMAQYLRDTPIVEGRDGNLSDIRGMQKEGGNTIRSFKDIEKQVDEELKTKMRGKAKLGKY